MVGGIRAWPVISTVTAKPVSLITANRPRLIPEGTVSVIAPSGGSPPSGSRSKKKYRRSSVLVRVRAFELVTAIASLAVSAASSSPAWSLIVTSF
jgi:hypothetical protein